jgi:C4-dicarboxylate-specific signal transduction histidine kinase
VGLGVSISESIVAEYGGRLEYSSEQGMGTVVSVSLRGERQ